MRLIIHSSSNSSSFRLIFHVLFLPLLMLPLTRCIDREYLYLLNINPSFDAIWEDYSDVSGCTCIKISSCLSEKYSSQKDGIPQKAKSPSFITRGLNAYHGVLFLRLSISGCAFANCKKKKKSKISTELFFKTLFCPLWKFIVFQTLHCGFQVLVLITQFSGMDFVLWWDFVDLHAVAPLIWIQITWPVIA